MNAIPNALAKQGIARLTDNRDGRQLVLAPRGITMYFGRELRAALEAKQRAGAALPDTVSVEQNPCPAK